MQNKLKSVIDFTKKNDFRRLLRETGILMLFLVGAGCLSVFLEQDVAADFLAYHYYNGFSFLNDRLAYDIAPAQMSTYYNPLLDAALYLLDNAFSKTPFLFIMGLPAGLALFIVYKIAVLFFTDGKKIWIPLTLLISMTGFAFFRQIGTCSHEITIACFVLASLYILLKKPEKTGWYFTAGALLGAAAGFKLTAAIYCVSTGLTLLLFYKTLDKPKTFIGFFILGGLTGFLAVDGFWMRVLWKNFQNPFFPFWNKIFKSPYFYDLNYIDDLHLSYSLKKLLFLPFIIFSGNFLGAETQNTVGDINFSDARWVIAYVLLFVFVIKLFNKQFRNSLSEKTLFTVVFLFVSYLLWLFSSQNIRFTVPVEMLFGVVFIKALSRCPLPEKFFTEVFAGTTALILFLILVSTPLFSGRWGDYVRSPLPVDAIFPEEVLILTNDIRNTYTATMFAERTKARIINKINYPTKPSHIDFSNFNKFGEIKKELLEKNGLPLIYIITLHNYKAPQIDDASCYIITNLPSPAPSVNNFLCASPEIIHNIFQKNAEKSPQETN